MPLRNPFRRPDTAPTLRDHAAGLRAILGKPNPQTTSLPVPGSAEAMAAWHAACHQHTIRTAALHDCPELMRPDRDVWSIRSLGTALETGEITPAEYARLHLLASERELRFAGIAHDLKIGALFALAYAAEYPLEDMAAGNVVALPTPVRSASANRTQTESAAERDLCKEASHYAYDLDLSRIPLDCLLRLSDVFHREAEVLNDVSQEDRFYMDLHFRVQNDGGEIVEAESNRLGCIRDACIAEIARRTPQTEKDRDAALVARVHHEMLCEMKVRNKALLAEMQAAWGGE